MDLQNSFIVPADIDTAWKTLLDVESIAPCMPGATVWAQAALAAICKPSASRKKPVRRRRTGWRRLAVVVSKLLALARAQAERRDVHDMQPQTLHEAPAATHA